MREVTILRGEYQTLLNSLSLCSGPLRTPQSSGQPPPVQHVFPQPQISKINPVLRLQGCKEHCPNTPGLDTSTLSDLLSHSGSH